MEFPPTCRFFFVGMDRINGAIPFLARRLAELFPTRDHGRPITVGIREQGGFGRTFPVEKLLGKIKEAMGPKPVTVFDVAGWAQETYPRLMTGTVWNILSCGPGQIKSQVILVFVRRDLFHELASILEQKPPEDDCPVAEVHCSYPSGNLNIQEVIYPPPAKT